MNYFSLLLCKDYQVGDSVPDCSDIARSRREKEKVVLNIGGHKHEVMWRLLARHPRSRLGLLASASTARQVTCTTDYGEKYTERSFVDTESLRCIFARGKRVLF